MSATNNFENGLLALIFGNVGVANVGDATGLRGSTSAGSFWISLHTADPGEGGSQITNEATYTGYARISAPRSPVIFSVASGVVSNAQAAAFPACTAGTETLTHIGIGSSQTLAGNLFVVAALAPVIVSPGLTPSFAIGDFTVTLD